MSIDLVAARLARRIRAAEAGRPVGVLDDRALREAEQLRRHAEQTGAGGERARLLSARLYWERYRAGRAAELSAVVERYNEIVVEDGGAIPNEVRAAMQSRPKPRAGRGSLADSTRRMLAIALADNDEPLVDRVLSKIEWTVGMLHEDHPERAPLQVALSDARLQRFFRLGDVTDLDLTVDSGNAALPRLPDRGADTVMCLGNLGTALRLRYEFRHRRDDLEAAVRHTGRAAQIVAPDSHHFPTVKCVHGQVLQMRFGLTRDPEDLDRAVWLMTEAADTCPRDDARLQLFLGSLIDLLLERIASVERAGDHDLLSAVAERLEAALGAEPDRAALANLARAYAARAESSDDITLFDRAITLIGRAIARAGTGDRPGRKLRVSLAELLWRRYSRTGDGTNLAEAADLFQAAVRDSPPGDPGLGPALGNLVSVLQVQYDVTGNRAYLDEATSVLDRAPRTDALVAELAPARSNNAFYRYRRHGAVADLDVSLAEAERVVAARAAPDRRRPPALCNLAQILTARFERSADPADLHRAASLTEEAYKLLDEGSAWRAEVADNYGRVLSQRYELTRDPADFRRARRLAAEALREAGAESRGVPTAMIAMSNLHLRRFEAEGRPTDLDVAIRWAERALAGPKQTGTDLAMIQNNVAACLRHRNTPADADRAIALLETAAQDTAAPPGVRVQAAHSRAELIAETRGRPAALEAYRDVVTSFLPLVSWRGLHRTDQYHQLKRFARWLGSDAAACAVEAGRLQLAVELVEAGRGVLWSQILANRADLTAVRNADPGLAEELAQCIDRLDGSPDSFQEIKIGAAGRAAARRRSAERYDALVARVRGLPPSEELPSPENFLRPTPFHELAPRDGGAVTIVNISRWRCDVLLVRHGEVQLIALPEVTFEGVVEETNRYLEAVQTFEDTDGGPDDRHELDRELRHTLDWLWNSVVRHVHAAVPEGRLWWCPTGGMALLPLHAAGPHEVIASYTPSLRGLQAARTRPAGTRDGRLLVVAIPETPGQEVLPSAVAESRIVTDAVGASGCTELTGPAATRQAILRDLPTHSWLHAACHGSQVLDDPEAAGLLPFDWADAGPISIADLLTLGPTAGELAYLSACKTATAAVTHLDESLTIATALSHGGWRHVIGTLWTVWDRAAVRVCREFYPRVVTNGSLDPQHAAQALHDAVHRLRQAYPDSPSMWVPFLHVGP